MPAQGRNDGITGNRDEKGTKGNKGSLHLLEARSCKFNNVVWWNCCLKPLLSTDCTSEAGVLCHKPDMNSHFLHSCRWDFLYDFCMFSTRRSQNIPGSSTFLIFLKVQSILSTDRKPPYSRYLSFYIIYPEPIYTESLRNIVLGSPSAPDAQSQASNVSNLKYKSSML